MTGGGGVMTTSASIGVIYSTLQTPSCIWVDGIMGRGRKGKEDEGGKENAGRGKEREGEEKGREKNEKRKGERERWYTPLLVQSDANVSQWYTYEKNRPSDT